MSAKWDENGNMRALANHTARALARMGTTTSECHSEGTCDEGRGKLHGEALAIRGATMSPLTLLHGAVEAMGVTHHSGERGDVRQRIRLRWRHSQPRPRSFISMIDSEAAAFKEGARRKSPLDLPHSHMQHAQQTRRKPAGARAPGAWPKGGVLGDTQRGTTGAHGRRRGAHKLATVELIFAIRAGPNVLMRPELSTPPYDGLASAHARPALMLRTIERGNRKLSAGDVREERSTRSTGSQERVEHVKPCIRDRLHAR